MKLNKRERKEDYKRIRRDRDGGGGDLTEFAVFSNSLHIFRKTGQTRLGKTQIKLKGDAVR